MASNEAAGIDDQIEDWFEADVQTEATGSEEVTADPEVKYAKSQLRVVRETKDYQLDYLKHALQPGREIIDISPAYQRRLRWSNSKKALLIESLLLNIPVPPIFLYERDYNAYEVIDGRQRLDAISGFLANEYALTTLEYWPELNRKRFSDLPLVLQRGLLRRSLSAVVLLAESGTAEAGGVDVRRVLFDRLNTGGIKLNPQELRNALYPGEFNAMLIRLARSDVFTDVWGIPQYRPGEEDDPSPELLKNQLFASLADAELVLRFFALRDAVKHDRKGSLRTILDRYMAKQVRAEGEDLDDLGHLFERCLRRLRTVFADDTFRLPDSSRLSRPLYDALMVALSLDESVPVESNAHEIRAALEAALSIDATYDVLVGRGNTIAAVHDRVSLASRILNAHKAGQ